MRPLRNVLLALAGLALPGATMAQVGQCYDSRTGVWTPVPTQSDVSPMPLPTASGDSLSYAFPPRIRIDSGGVFSIPDGALPTVHATMEWSRAGSSLDYRLDRQKGYVGLTGSLAPSDEGFVGHARTYTHRPGLQRYRQELVLREVPCDSPVPVSASEDTDLPLRVTLNDGRIFALGPLPPGSEILDGRTEVVLESVDASGVYLGATRLILAVESRVVVRIDVYFDDSGAQVAFDRMAARFGARDGNLWSWNNRSGIISGSHENAQRIGMRLQPSGEPEDPR